MTQEQLGRPDEDMSGAYEATPPGVTRLAQIQVPVLAIAGELDAADIQAMITLIEQQAPTVKKVTIADAGHLPNMEQPQQFNEALLEWLAWVDESHT